MLKCAGVLLCWVILAGGRANADGSAGAGERVIHRSDVVFMYDNAELYETYGCTVLGWAGWGNAQRIEEAHAKGVRLFSTSVGFRTEFRGMIDFDDHFLEAACRNFAGEPFIVPWLWDHKHKGQPAWWWCTNSPLYRKYLDSRLVSVMKAQPDGLHIDDYTGTAGAVTWLSGCFCTHCMAGFRGYVAESVPKEKLAELGIADPSAFDYRRFLLAAGVKPEEYNKRRGSLPLAAEFHDFQVKANNAFVAEYRARAEQLRGKPLALCVNSWLNSPASLVIAPRLSHVCCEVPHHAPGMAAAKHPIYIYKMGDGLRRPVTSTAAGHDWAYVKEHNLPCLVRSWIALSYAFGQNFMAPHRQWCYTKEKGTHWYTTRPEDYAYVYQFIRQNAGLLDGYEAVAPVAVVYDNAARRKWRGDVEPICLELAERNVPFTVLVAGDDWLDYRLDPDRVGSFKAVVVAKQREMDNSQKKLLEQVGREGRLVVWPDQGTLDKLLPVPITIEGSGHVGVVPRAIPGSDAAPVVVHLLNRRYAGPKDAMIPQRGFTLRLRRDLFGGRAFSKATLHAPKAEPQVLTVTTGDEHTSVKVPELTLWAILELGD